MSAMRGVNLLKLMKLIDLLSKPTGATYDEMVEELGVTIRTVYRLVDALGELGFPIIDETIRGDRRKRKKLMEEFRRKLPNMTVPEITFTQSELFVLALLKSEDTVLRDTELGEALERIFARLALIMPNGLGDKLTRIRALFVSRPVLGKSYTGKEKIIDQVFRAVLASRRCTITYHAFTTNTVKTYQIDPLQFFEHQGGLYFFARVVKYGDIRILAIERIKEIEVLAETFVWPDGFLAETYLQSAFGLTLDDEIEVTIRFSANQANHIKERFWAVEQKLTTNKDGSVALWMRTSGWYDVKRWVLSFGVEAEVLEPAELRSEMKQDIQGMGRLY